MKAASASSVRAADVLQRCALPDDAIERAGLDWAVLDAVARDYQSSRHELELCAGFCLQQLRQLPVALSLQVQAMEAADVVAEIVRRKLSGDAFSYDASNYRERLTDLVKITALHPFRQQWRVIHQAVVSTWNLYQAPVACLQPGDSEQLEQELADAGCDVLRQPRGRRGIHYLLTVQLTKRPQLMELQVGTLIEAGRSELDRCAQQAERQSPYLRDLLGAFDRLAGSADAISGIISALGVPDPERQQAAVPAQEPFVLGEDSALRQLERELTAKEEQIVRLEREIDALRRVSTPPIPAAATGPQLLRALERPRPAEPLATAAKTCIDCGRTYLQNPYTLHQTDYCETCRLRCA